MMSEFAEWERPSQPTEAWTLRLRRDGISSSH